MSDLPDELPIQTIGDFVVRAAPSKEEQALDAVVTLLPNAAQFAIKALQVAVDEHNRRHQLTLREIIEAVSEEKFAELMSQAKYQALLYDALDTVNRTGYEDKRKLLSRVVANAFRDDARFDDSQSLVQALRELDSQHIRALMEIERAESTAVKASDIWGDSNVRRIPAAVRAALIRTGVAASGPGAIFSSEKYMPLDAEKVEGLTSFGRLVLSKLRDG